MEKVNCSLCGSDEKKLLFKCRDCRYHLANDDFNLVRCQRCGLVYVSPRPTQEELGKFYPGEYYGDARIGFFGDVISGFLNLQPVHDVRKYKRQGRLLDIGCGTGGFVLEMKKRGFETYGVDISSKACRLAREKGLSNIYQGTLEKPKFPDNYFDVITLWHVLEHLPYPDSILSEIHRIIKKDGILLLEVPNIESLPFKIFKRYWFHLDIPRHLCHWSRKTVGRLLEKNNFEVLQTDYFSLEFPLSTVHGFSYWLNTRQIKSPLNLLILITMAPVLLVITIIFHLWPYQGETLKVFARKK